MIHLNTNIQHNSHNNRYQETSSSNGFSSQIFQKNNTNSNNPQLLSMLLNLIVRLIQQLAANKNDAPSNTTKAPQEKTKTNPPQVATTTPPVTSGEEKQKGTNKSDLPHVSVSDPKRFENEEKPQQAKQPATTEITKEKVTEEKKNSPLVTQAEKTSTQPSTQQKQDTEVIVEKPKADIQQLDTSHIRKTAEATSAQKGTVLMPPPPPSLAVNNESATNTKKAIATEVKEPKGLVSTEEAKSLPSSATQRYFDSLKESDEETKLKNSSDTVYLSDFLKRAINTQLGGGNGGFDYNMTNYAKDMDGSGKLSIGDVIYRRETFIGAPMDTGGTLYPITVDKNTMRAINSGVEYLEKFPDPKYPKLGDNFFNLEPTQLPLEPAKKPELSKPPVSIVSTKEEIVDSSKQEDNNTQIGKISGGPSSTGAYETQRSETQKIVNGEERTIKTTLTFLTEDGSSRVKIVEELDKDGFLKSKERKTFQNNELKSKYRITEKGSDYTKYEKGGVDVGEGAGFGENYKPDTTDGFNSWFRENIGDITNDGKIDKQDVQKFLKGDKSVNSSKTPTEPPIENTRELSGKLSDYSIDAGSDGITTSIHLSNQQSGKTESIEYKRGEKPPVDTITFSDQVLTIQQVIEEATEQLRAEKTSTVPPLATTEDNKNKIVENTDQLTDKGLPIVKLGDPRDNEITQLPLESAKEEEKSKPSSPVVRRDTPPVVNEAKDIPTEEDVLVPLGNAEKVNLSNAVLHQEGIGAPEDAERLDSVIDEDGNGKLSVGDTLKIVSTKSAETGDFTPVARFETLTQAQLDRHNGTYGVHSPGGGFEGPKGVSGGVSLTAQQETTIREQFQIPEQAHVFIAEQNYDNKLSEGDIVVTTLDGKTYESPIKASDIKLLDRIVELDTQRDLFQTNKSKWEQSDLKEYSYTLTLGTTTGGSGQYENKPIRVGVTSGEAKEITSTGKQYKPTVHTIDEIFERISNALGEKGTNVTGRSISVKYDSETGQPISFSSHPKDHSVPRSHFDGSKDSPTGRLGVKGSIGSDGGYSYKISNLSEGLSQLTEAEKNSVKSNIRSNVHNDQLSWYTANVGIDSDKNGKIEKSDVLAWSGSETNKSNHQDSGFYDWFKKEHGDFNKDGEINRKDVIDWLKSSKEPKQLNLTDTQNDILKKKLLVPDSGSVRIFDSNGDNKISVGDTIKSAHGFSDSKGAGDAQGIGSVNQTLLNELGKSGTNAQDSAPKVNASGLTGVMGTAASGFGPKWGTHPKQQALLDSLYNKDGNTTVKIRDPKLQEEGLYSASASLTLTNESKGTGVELDHIGQDLADKLNKLGYRAFGADVPSLSLSTDQYNQIKSAVEESDRTNSGISSIEVIDLDYNGELSKGDRVVAYMNSTIGLTGSGNVDDSFLEGNGFKKFGFGS